MFFDRRKNTSVKIDTSISGVAGEVALLGRRGEKHQFLREDVLEDVFGRELFRKEIRKVVVSNGDFCIFAFFWGGRFPRMGSNHHREEMFEKRSFYVFIFHESVRLF